MKKKMNSNDLIYTDHALFRMSQRGVSKKDIALVVEKGTRYRKAGAIFIFMRQKDTRTKNEDRLRNLTVVLTKKGMVKTVYKNGKSLKDIKRKEKKDIKKWRQDE